MRDENSDYLKSVRPRRSATSVRRTLKRSLTTIGFKHLGDQTGQVREVGTGSRSLAAAADVADLFRHGQFKVAGVEPDIDNAERLDPLTQGKLALVASFD